MRCGDADVKLLPSCRAPVAAWRTLDVALRRFASEGTTKSSENRPSSERTASQELQTTGGGHGQGSRTKPQGFAEKRTDEMRRRDDFWEGVSAGQARRITPA